jgi:DNA polymerase III subunit epsilon
MSGPLRRLFYRATLGDHRYRFLFEAGPKGELVSLDCETTGLNPRTDEIVAVAAVRIRGNRILTSERFEEIVRPETGSRSGSIKVHQLRAIDVEKGRPMHEVLPDLLRFIGGRPLVGYYIDFDVRMLDKYVLSLIQAKLPNRQIEVSEMYYATKYKGVPTGTNFDLRFVTILADLGIPSLHQHNAFNDAVMAAMIYLQLRDLQERGKRLPRPRISPMQPIPMSG